MRMKKFNRFKTTIKWQTVVASTSLLLSIGSVAGPYEQAKRMHDRLTGVPPTEAVLDQMATLLSGPTPDGIAAARIAMDDEGFYGGTLKRMAAPWTNRDQDAYATLDDYIATFIGYVRDDRDIRGLLYDNWVYHGGAAATPAYSLSNNQHYENLENSGVSLRDSLVGVEQTTVRSAAIAPAGIQTTRSAAEAFFILGTNRAMLRFTLMNHLCTDLEQMQDEFGVIDRIRQDISRSPGGDSELFTRGCAGCHIGMDPMAQAYAYYNWDLDPDNDGDPTNTTPVFDYNDTAEYNAVLEQYNPGLASFDTRVQPKYHINGANFNPGYITLSDDWENYWREGKNAKLQWNWGGGSPDDFGQGAASMGRELANSYAFAQCKVKQVFEAVCLREPVDDADQQQILDLTGELRDDQGFGLRDTFAKVADYCKGV